MRLPGTRYQEHGWEQVRKLLGQCSLHVFRQCDMAQQLDRGRSLELLDWYAGAVALVFTLISGYWLWLAPKLRRGRERGGHA